MTEILRQYTLAASKSKHLATHAAQIKSTCLAQHQHGDSTKSLLSCPPCYSALLDAFKTTYYTPPPPPNPPLSDPQTQQHQQEERPPSLPSVPALPSLIDSAAAYQTSPQAIDDLVRAARSRWYAAKVRTLLPRLLAAEDAAGARAAVLEKLEDLAATRDGDGDGDGDGDADVVCAAAGEIAEILRTGPLAPGGVDVGDVAGRLAAVSGGAGCQRYLDMLAHQGLSMEQVVDRILDERQATAGAREQADKLGQRLDELRRARATHELQKSKKAQRRESLAQQRVPDELYDLPACSVCGETPTTTDFFCCSICTILAGRGVMEQPTVFCSQACEEKGHASHAETHLCSSSSKCTQLQRDDSGKDTPPRPSPHDLRFCTECLVSLKQPTLWCSLACADADFQHHRDEVHLPERQKLGLGVNDEQQLQYGDRNGNDDSSRRYRARDIRTLTTSLEEAVTEWEARNRVRLQG
ncbi:hypothetical protein BT67DRAFT_434819 [Trichocladium antarcticum]|uniref:Uncharacterized protein n=1 Tax=Trichocladium antarcticum TaxID=1450529 RepID=A0AAN6ZD29_9PEZI|nr:hypothetical protein BT67DRAFT_434819 [Trichocladium antarcticum]